MISFMIAPVKNSTDPADKQRVLKDADGIITIAYRAAQLPACDAYIAGIKSVYENPAEYGFVPCGDIDGLRAALAAAESEATAPEPNGQ